MAMFERTLRTFDSASLTANYQDVGAVLEFAVKKASIINASTVAVLINNDTNADDDIRLPIGATLSISSDNEENNGIFNKGSQILIKQVTGAGTGSIIFNLFGE